MESEEDSDLGRTGTRYWPCIHQINKIPLAMIELWKRGSELLLRPVKGSFFLRSFS